MAKTWYIRSKNTKQWKPSSPRHQFHYRISIVLMSQEFQILRNNMVALFQFPYTLKISFPFSSPATDRSIKVPPIFSIMINMNIWDRVHYSILTGNENPASSPTCYSMLFMICMFFKKENKSFLLESLSCLFQITHWWEEAHVP